MSVKRGFTLIEILIVIVIIGITVGFALLAFGDFGASRRLQFSAEQLVSTLKMAQQQALLETSTLGLRIDNASYQILRFKPPSSWNPLSNQGVFKTTYFPKNTLIHLETNTPSSSGSPTVILSASGEMTPFVLRLRMGKEINVTTIKGTHNGQITLFMAQSQ